MLSWRRMLLIVVAPVAVKSAIALLGAREPTTGDDSFTPSPEFQQWITDLVREHLPADYEKKKNWGHQAKSFDGVSVRMEDGRIKTHRKYEDKNDGQWQMYRVKLKNPQENLDIQIGKIRKLADGKIGLEVTAIASLEVFGRQAQWEHGVQLYSLSAEADARVKLWANVEVATHVDWSRLPPDVALDPQVTAAKFEVPDFHMRRIGQFEGPVVRSLTIRETLEEQLADDNQKLVDKLNPEIDKQEKKLRLSLADIMQSKWKWLVGDNSK